MRSPFSLLVLAVAVSAPGQPAELPEFKSARQLVVEMSPEADFTIFRQLWTRTFHYNPFLDISDAYQDALRQMRKALEANDYEVATALCRQRLDEYLVDIRWHLRCADAYRGAQVSESVKFHEYMYRGLMRSITASGDGESPESAYWVLSYAEQYAVFAVEGVKKLGQSLIKADGKSYDRIEVQDESTGDKRAIYFEVDTMLSWQGGKP